MTNIIDAGLIDNVHLKCKIDLIMQLITEVKGSEDKKQRQF